MQHSPFVLLTRVPPGEPGEEVTDTERADGE